MVYLKTQGDLLNKLGLGQVWCMNFIDNCSPFWPISSAINSPTYKLAKFLVPILQSFTSNEYTVKDSLAFAEEIAEQDSEFSMGSLDVDSLFTNIPLEETIDICANTLFENTEIVEGLSKIEFKEHLSLATKEFVCLFNLFKVGQICNSANI